jgi:purine-binding chemotaxis protein CheW
MQELYGNSQRLDEREQSTQKGKFLTFKLDAELFALEISYVTEIYNMLSIVPLPGTPEYFKGIINLRGKIIPVIDMRLKLRKISESYNDRTCIIILIVDGIQSGLIVDTVSEVCNIREEDIEPPPGLKCLGSNHYIQGVAKIGDDLAMILDCRKILGEEKISNLAQEVS